jgi:hypothetical protein
MRIIVKGFAVDEGGTEHPVDIDLDWEECRVNRETGRRVYYGGGDSWHAVLPAPHKSTEQGEKR